MLPLTHIGTRDNEMKIEALADRFRKSKGQPIQLGSDTVCAMYQMPISAGGHVLRILRASAKANPVQGLRLKIGGGELLINGQILSDIVLWADNSPKEVAASISATKDTVLKIWNVWSIGGAMNAWIGNAGMLVAETDDNIWLRCSDGIGDVDFSDFVVSVALHSDVGLI